MTPTSFYLAGPMTGVAQFNFPSFDAAAAALRDEGYEIVSPAESHSAVTRDLCLASPDGDLHDLECAAEHAGETEDQSYGQFMARDIEIIIDEVEGVVVLPEWWTSRGAKIEVFTALTMGKPVYEYECVENVVPPLRRLPDHAVYATLLAAGEPMLHTPPNTEPSGLFEAPVDVPEDFLNASSNAITEARTRFQTPVQIDVGEDAPDVQTLWGLPVVTSPSVEPGWLHVVTDRETLSVPWDPRPPETYEATREPGHIHAEVRVEGEREKFLALSGHAEEERITSSTGGAKGAKLCSIGDLDPQALMKVGEVAGFGARKYERLNYTKGFAWSLAFNALMRHALLFWSGEDYDEESELPHMAHAAWQALCLMSFAEHLRGTDDRHINYYMEGEPRELQS